MVVFEIAEIKDIIVLDCWSRCPYFRRSTIFAQEDKFGSLGYYYLPKGCSLTDLSISHPSITFYSKHWAEAFEDPS